MSASLSAWQSYRESFVMDHAKIKGTTEVANLATCIQPCDGIIIQAVEMEVVMEKNVFVFT